MLIDFGLKEKFKDLKKAGRKLPAEYFDLGVAYWLINPDEKEYSPDHLSGRFLRKEYPSAKSRQAAIKKELYNFAIKKLKEYRLENLFYDVEMPLVKALAEMEGRGIKLDLDYLRALDKELAVEIQRLVETIYKEAGEPFNINSPKQLGEVIFKKMKIDAAGVKKTRTGQISTNEETLLLIKDRHPIVKHLLDYRELFKLHSTYVRPFRELVGKDGRIHTTYIQTGTATGRLSSQNPNLQNIPVGGDWAKKLRKSFIADKGYKLVSFDYSQIELRILASLSGDPKMIEAFNNDLDIHKLTAANVFNVPLEKVTPEMRRLAKTLNFGVIFGMGAIAFAKTGSISISEARKFIDEYFNDFKNVREWHEKIKSEARTFGYVVNLNGRRRWLLGAVSVYRGEAAEAERAAINMPIQSLDADIMKIAMVRIYEEIKKKKWQEKVRMLLTIHDELLFEIKEDIMKEANELIKKIMESAYELEVPLKVASKAGESWGEFE